MKPTAIILLNCPDRQGIITEVTKFITDNRGNIVYLDQYVDRENGVLFMRIENGAWNSKSVLPFSLVTEKTSPSERGRLSSRQVGCRAVVSEGPAGLPPIEPPIEKTVPPAITMSAKSVSSPSSGGPASLSAHIEPPLIVIAPDARPLLSIASFLSEWQ